MGFLRVRILSANDIIWTQVSGHSLQGSHHWTTTASWKQVLFWSILAYHRCVLVPPFLQSFKFIFSCSVTYFPKVICYVTDAYVFLFINILQWVKKIWGNERGKATMTLRLQMLGVCSVSWGQRSQRETALGMQNLVLCCGIPSLLFSPPFSVYPKFRCLVSWRIT